MLVTNFHRLSRTALPFLLLHAKNLNRKLQVCCALSVSILFLHDNFSYAQDSGVSMSLKTVPVPGPSPAMLSEFVKDKKAAIQLGKALFWDTRVGSDNKTSCATCHFSAGVDNRSKNQLDPGALRRFPRLAPNSPYPDSGFQLGGGPNYQLRIEDFPFTRHINEADANGAGSKIADVNEVASSQGVFTANFRGISGKTENGPDECDVIIDHHDGFSINNINTRRVEPRNTPSVINAVFNFRNFWDGRANNVFNGGDPFGLRNTAPLIWKREAGLLRQVKVALPSSSLASQGSGPPLSGTEMSCTGRAFVKLGQKLLHQKILTDQTISASDSVLGQYAAGKPIYRAMIAKAFHADYWQSPSIIRFTRNNAKRIGSMDLDKPRPFDNFIDTNASQMEANFSLFFSLAVQLYQSTLIADDSPFDRYAEGKGTLSDQAIDGLKIFRGKGQCINCHGGAEMTNASFRNVISQRLEKMTMSDGSVKTYDNGFYNIGVRPTSDDIGIGGVDPFGNPLSETLLFAISAENSSLLGNNFDPSKYERPGVDKVSVNGAFKTPGLRNVELTGPYFHNGGKATLMQVVDFYNRGGDFAQENRDNLAPDIRPLNLSEQEKESLVAFLVSLTDERVRYERAPFDHPSLCLPHGHPGDTKVVTNSGNGNATDINPLKCLKAVGASGSSRKITPFLGYGVPPKQR
ncbi:cytochrome-c peroxidase [Massilia jejuensis]|uniref:Cytochrome-c peroxidase n=1 Tax=Massilia jejuensis TaxID=648894 RepID=A0ABW0PMJ1_9BURK